MADIFDSKERSEIMKRVRSKGNKSTELRLIEIFHKSKIVGWRRGYPVKGHPDFVFIDKRIAIFVDGCFWHGHDCRNTQPSEHKEYWEKKQEHNKMHDKEVTELFKARGWIVLRIWECELKKDKKENTVKKIQQLLESTPSCQVRTK